MCWGVSLSYSQLFFAKTQGVCSQVQVHFVDWFTPPSLSGALSWPCSQKWWRDFYNSTKWMWHISLKRTFFFTSLWYILTSLACFSEVGHRETRCDAARVIRCFIDFPTHLPHTGQNKQLQQAFTCGDSAFKNTWVGCLLDLWAKLSSWRLTSLISVSISPTHSNWNIDRLGFILMESACSHCACMGF